MTTYRADKGSNGLDNLESYGQVGSTDRALGILYSGSVTRPGTMSFGVHMQNADASQYITSITVTYTGEQWHQGVCVSNSNFLHE